MTRFLYYSSPLHVAGQPGTHTFTFLFFPQMPNLGVGPWGGEKGKSSTAAGPSGAAECSLPHSWTAWLALHAGNNSPVSHPSPSTPHLAYPIPGNLQMQTEEGLSSLVPSDLLLSVWGDLCPELVKGYGVCWFWWRGHSVVMENWACKVGLLLLRSWGKNYWKQPVCKGTFVFI